ncbi:periplasmic component of amino acid ABC-type transporter/signal transduction system [Rheinheimera sp. A13L]|nr:periplasmic component of amino acid ABC-type transporter/signal transduction system [Rheinheimera sp. A13L]
MKGNWFRTTLIGCICLIFSYLSPVSIAAIQCPEKAWTAGLYEHGVLFFDGRSGIDQDIINEIRHRTGCKIYSSLMPRARIWYDLEQANLDMSVSGVETPERLLFAWFVPYMQMKNIVLLSPEVPLSVQQPEEFLLRSDLRFGAVRSFKHGLLHDTFLQQLTTQNRVLYYTDSITLFKALKQGRVQAIFAQSPVYRRLLPQLQFAVQPRMLDWYRQEQGVPHGLVLAKASFTQPDVEHWRLLMEELKRDGTLLKIYSVYLPQQEAEALIW